MDAVAASANGMERQLLVVPRNDHRIHSRTTDPRGCPHPRTRVRLFELLDRSGAAGSSLCGILWPAEQNRARIAQARGDRTVTDKWHSHENHEAIGFGKRFF
jgi:hypothetical protein